MWYLSSSAAFFDLEGTTKKIEPGQFLQCTRYRWYGCHLSQSKTTSYPIRTYPMNGTILTLNDTKSIQHIPTLNLFTNKRPEVYRTGIGGIAQWPGIIFIIFGIVIWLKFEEFWVDQALKKLTLVGSGSVTSTPWSGASSTLWRRS